MKVSVIIPVYNMEKYLDQCMESLLAQTLQDFEILCVDDGSTDNTLNMLRGYEQRDNRIKVKTQKNQYSGVARNNGLADATGEYVIFIDPDDFVERDMLANMYDRCVKCDADICVCPGRYYHNDTGKFSPWPMLVDTFIPQREFFKASELGKNAFRFTTSGPPNKMFRRSFLEKHQIRYASLPVAQDLPFVCLAEALAERITVINDKPYYNYRVNLTTNAQSRTYKWPLSCAQAHTILRDSLIKTGVFDQYKAAYENFTAFEIERYAKRYCCSEDAFSQYHAWYHDVGKDIYDIHISSLNPGTLSNLLMTFDGVTMDMDAPTVRALVAKNSEKYAAMYSGHKAERIAFVYKKLRGIEGTPRATARTLGLVLEMFRRA